MATPWNTQESLAVGSQITGKPNPVPGHYFWGPVDDGDPSPAFDVLPGQRAAAVWDADTNSTDTGTESLTIQIASGFGSSPNEWVDYDTLPAGGVKILAVPGTYRFVPSGQVPASRLKLSFFFDQ